uniref:Uncharacterized protein n=1 Tax=Tetraodon nigroviridis TaxID=99883 RepID=H3DJT9_TETNG
ILKFDKNPLLTFSCRSCDQSYWKHASQFFQCDLSKNKKHCLDAPQGGPAFPEKQNTVRSDASSCTIMKEP